MGGTIRVLIAQTVWAAAGAAVWMQGGGQSLFAYVLGIGVTGLLLVILVPPRGPKNTEVRQ